MKHPKSSHAFEVVRELPEPLSGLQRLASNYWWTWDHGTRDLFRAVDKALWDECEHNPVLFLNRMPTDRAARLAKDRGFLARIESCVRRMEEYLSGETWFDQTFPGAREGTTIAYFCAEFGVSEGLPIYSGGLGVLAGDHLKAASDLGVPLVAVGLLYNRGYFRQRLNRDGWQQEIYPQGDFYQMPLTLMRDGSGHPICIEVDFPDRPVSCQIWRADVGRVPLYLLDSNVLDNAPGDQAITDTLYGGDQDTRARQEAILGIGGLRALHTLGIRPTVCHMNEGHAAFLAIERVRQTMSDHGCDFRTAKQAAVTGNVFTTHTPVEAGFDLFEAPLLEKTVARTVALTGLPFGEFLEMGKIHPEAEPKFNMAVFAMENSSFVNGVSQLHASVSRGMFADRWSSYPEDEVPIEGITNGIHTTTWMGGRMSDLLDQYLGGEWRRRPEDPEVWAGVDAIPDEELWSAVESSRLELVRYARRRHQKDLERRGQGRPDPSAPAVLDPRVLTIGFARRFATYKRATLMASDKERLKRLLFHPERPVQIVIAGKAHPRDDAGKAFIQELVRTIEAEGLDQRMVFLEDYDMRVGRKLVQGVDVWLNNPRRPYEASGTSGMKVIPNGGLNLSVLDGWWDEAYEPGLGWAIGDRSEIGDPAHQDWLDSQSFYSVLEHEVTPMFYHRVDHGVPRGWVTMIKRSIRQMAHRFSTGRMVREYTERFYMPSSDTYRRMEADGLARARAALEWREKVRTNWPLVRVASVRDDASATNPVGREVHIRALVDLGHLTPEEVRVQVVVGKVDHAGDLHAPRVQDFQHVGEEAGSHAFEGTVACQVPGGQGYSIRVIPHHPDVRVPSQLGLVAWE